MPTFVDYAGMNTLVSSSIEGNTISSGRNTEVFSSGIPVVDELVGINIHRNGPYGYSSWKQLRVSENPVTRNHVANSTMTFVVEPGPVMNLGKNGELRVRSRYSALYNYTEPAIAQKSYPLIWNVGRHFKDEDGQLAPEPQKFSIMSSYANQQIGFANEKVDKLLKYDTDEEQAEYVAISEMYLDNGLNKQDSPLTHWEFLQYRETVYPHMKNQFQKENLTRPNFVSFFRHNRLNRSFVVGPDITAPDYSTNRFGYRPNGAGGKLNHSHWSMDAEENFLTRDLSTLDIIPDEQDSSGTPGNVQKASTGSAGVLQQNYSQYMQNSPFKNGPTTTYVNFAKKISGILSPLPNFARKISLFNVKAVSNPTGMEIPETGSAAHSGGGIAFRKFELVLKAGEDPVASGNDPDIANINEFNSRTVTFADGSTTFIIRTAVAGAGSIVRNGVRDYTLTLANSLTKYQAVSALFVDTFTSMETAGDSFGFTMTSTYQNDGFYYVTTTSNISSDMGGSFYENIDGTKDRILGGYEIDAGTLASSIEGFLTTEGWANTGSHLFTGNAHWDAPTTRQIKSGSTFVSVPRYPFFDTYEEYAEELRRRSKNFSVIPEYRMSTQVQDYLQNDGAIELDMFDVTGGVSGAADSSKDRFYEIYSNSDFMRQFELINDDHSEFTNGKVLSLRCKALKKILPYEGFYPAQRTVQLSEQFYSDYNSSISMEIEGATVTTFEPLSENFGSEIIQRPLFGPGVLFNSIKSGVAVDYPVAGANATEVLGDVDKNEWFYTGSFSKRIPFEALVEPQKYLGGERIRINEPHPSGSLPFTAILGQASDGNYVKMANNFLAETIEFFLPNGNLTSISSRRQGTGILLKKDEVFGMRISMNRSMLGKRSSAYSGSDTANYYLPPQDIVDGKISESFTMYSRPSAFGPPSMGKTKFADDRVQNFDTDRFDYDSSARELRKDSRHGFNFPYTPPYYHGEAWCDIMLTSSKDTPYTIKEIQEQATYIYSRFDHEFYLTEVTEGTTISTSTGPQALVNINNNAVQISASLTVDGVASTKDKSDSLIVESAEGSNDRWIVQTKWETPMFNFNHLSSSDLNLPLYGSESVPRGIWHQYGRIPEKSEGVFVKVSEVPKSYQTNKMGKATPMSDLSEKLGFSDVGVKLGKLRSQKTIYEAVVAVPFIEQEGRKKFFTIDSSMVQAYKNGGEERAALTSGDPQNQIGRSVLNQLQKMEKYIFPPSFDFINNPIDEVSPIAMYIFEFSHTLSQQDLADIWQNLSPDISSTMEESEVAITHPLLKKELLGEGGQSGNTLIDMPNELRWMVFKVKQRAAANYFKKTVAKNSEVNTDVKSSNVTVDEFGDTSAIQYNWPYDFFSLVELVKIDAEVEFGNFRDEDIANYTDSIPSYESVEADRDKIEYIVGGLEDDPIPEVQIPELMGQELVVSTEVFAGQSITGQQVTQESEGIFDVPSTIPSGLSRSYVVAKGRFTVELEKSPTLSHVNIKEILNDVIRSDMDAIEGNSITVKAFESWSQDWHNKNSVEPLGLGGVGGGVQVSIKDQLEQSFKVEFSQEYPKVSGTKARKIRVANRRANDNVRKKYSDVSDIGQFIGKYSEYPGTPSFTIPSGAF